MFQRQHDAGRKADSDSTLTTDIPTLLPRQVILSFIYILAITTPPNSAALMACKMFSTNTGTGSRSINRS